jgi:hypothetical protein
MYGFMRRAAHLYLDKGQRRPAVLDKLGKRKSNDPLNSAFQSILHNLFRFSE